MPPVQLPQPLTGRKHGIEGKTIDGTDAWEVYNAVFDSGGNERGFSSRILDA